MPSYTGFGAGVVVAVVDTSGSIGEKEYHACMSEVQGVLAETKPEAVILIGADAAVNTVFYLQDGDSLETMEINLAGGGGTDFRPAFQWIEENHIDPNVVIYLTDMYGTFPDEAPRYQVIWVATTDSRAPFGRTIKMDV